MPELSHKSEKLASAIYLITGFFNDQEPLKWKLRSLASELVSLSLSLKDNLLKEKNTLISETKNVILKITGFISVAKNAGLLSLENHVLMQEELTKYANKLDYPINISDFLNLESPESKIREKVERLMIKDKSEYKSPNRSLKDFGAISIKKNGRQSVIIGVLKRKKEVMIKDISSLISGCSEKTIQRELSAMVRSGVLRRAGEKRWSRYSLSQSVALPIDRQA